MYASVRGLIKHTRQALILEQKYCPTNPRAIPHTPLLKSGRPRSRNQVRNRNVTLRTTRRVRAVSVFLVRSASFRSVFPARRARCVRTRTVPVAPGLTRQRSRPCQTPVASRRLSQLKRTRRRRLERPLASRPNILCQLRRSASVQLLRLKSRPPRYRRLKP